MSFTSVVETYCISTGTTSRYRIFKICTVDVFLLSVCRSASCFILSLIFIKWITNSIEYWGERVLDEIKENKQHTNCIHIHIYIYKFTISILSQSGCAVAMWRFTTSGVRWMIVINVFDILYLSRAYISVNECVKWKQRQRRPHVIAIAIAMAAGEDEIGNNHVFAVWFHAILG